jgi:hypothetical protein
LQLGDELLASATRLLSHGRPTALFAGRSIWTQCLPCHKRILEREYGDTEFGCRSSAAAEFFALHIRIHGL